MAQAAVAVRVVAVAQAAVENGEVRAVQNAARAATQVVNGGVVGAEAAVVAVNRIPGGSRLAIRRPLEVSDPRLIHPRRDLRVRVAQRLSRKVRYP
ncbi:MAG: hypothetical protein ACPGN3_05805 [Opitutales bacterium]